MEGRRYPNAAAAPSGRGDRGGRVETATVGSGARLRRRRARVLPRGPQRPPASARGEAGPAALRAAAASRVAGRPKGPEMHAVRALSVPPAGCRARLYRPTPGARALVLYL